MHRDSMRIGAPFFLLRLLDKRFLKSKISVTYILARGISRRIYFLLATFFSYYFLFLFSIFLSFLSFVYFLLIFSFFLLFLFLIFWNLLSLFTYFHDTYLRSRYYLNSSRFQILTKNMLMSYFHRSCVTVIVSVTFGSVKNVKVVV